MVQGGGHLTNIVSRKKLFATSDLTDKSFSLSTAWKSK